MRLCAVGDIIFGRYLPRPAGPPIYAPVARGGDPFVAVAPVLRRADVAFANLETPVMYEPQRFSINRVFTFRADPDRVPLLLQAGLSVLSLANNHTMNLGPRGAGESRRLLRQRGLHPVGAGASPELAYRPLIVVRNGLRLAFLAYTLWHGDFPSVTPAGAVAYLSERELPIWAPAAIQTARQDLRADFVIVSLHWGQEGEPRPSPAQRQAARALIDAGADVVLGHHPHLLQDFERHRGGLIAYSLGNFVFDNPSLAQRQTAILEVTLSGRGPVRRVRDARLVPVLTGLDNIPRLAQGADHRALAARLSALAPDIPIAPDPAAAAAPPVVYNSGR